MSVTTAQNGCNPTPSVAKEVVNTAEAWLEPTPTEPALLNNYRRATLLVLALAASGSKPSSVVLVAAIMDRRVADRGVFRKTTMCETFARMRTLELQFALALPGEVDKKLFGVVF